MVIREPFESKVIKAQKQQRFAVQKAGKLIKIIFYINANIIF